MEQQRQAFIEAAWGPLLSLLRQDARQPVPPNLSSDKAARQAIKDKWSAANKALAEAQAQQVRAGPRQANGRSAAAWKTAMTDWLLHVCPGLLQGWAVPDAGLRYALKDAIGEARRTGLAMGCRFGHCKARCRAVLVLAQHAPATRSMPRCAPPPPP